MEGREQSMIALELDLALNFLRKAAPTNGLLAVAVPMQALTSVPKADWRPHPQGFSIFFCLKQSNK